MKSSKLHSTVPLEYTLTKNREIQMVSLRDNNQCFVTLNINDCFLSYLSIYMLRDDVHFLTFRWV